MTENLFSGFINIRNKRDPRIDPWGIPFFNFPPFREKV
jgi:hypothetical protein